MKILLASRNRDKLKEIRGKVSDLDVEILSPDDFDDLPEVEEDGTTLEQNARKKTLTLHRLVLLPTLADDTGLEVAALGGKPGVFSSRFAGPGASYADNVNRLIQEMTGIPWDQRQACFRTVLAFAADGEVVFFEGSVKGYISLQATGASGFGYDPIFYVPAENATFAELPLERKNAISHRGKALDAWIAYLRCRHLSVI